MVPFAVVALFLAANPRARTAAQAAVRGSLGDKALLPLAIAGDEEDARFLLSHMEATKRVLAIEAVGCVGLLAAVPSLLQLLATADDDDVKLAAGTALNRLLGAELKSTIEVESETIEELDLPNPDPDPPKIRRPLAELVGDPRDVPPQPSREKLEVASIDPEAWRAYWDAHARELDLSKRYRRGRPHCPSVALFELDQGHQGPEGRRMLHRELSYRTGRNTDFDPHDFVVQQERSLKAWEKIVAGANESPGIFRQ